MVIDTSALLAILQHEDEAVRFASALAAARTRLMSAMTLLEASIVVQSRAGTAGIEQLDAFLIRAAIEIVPFDARQTAIARDAYARFGKGVHRARLNMGDCASYALARLRDEPLLFKGDDFVHTDITAADPPSRA